MAKIKEKNVDILNLEYLKEKDEYAIIFKISGLKPEKMKRIIKGHESGFLKSQGLNIEKIVGINGSLYLKEHYKKEHMGMYASLIPLAKKGILPERLDPEKTKIEEDLCMIERDMKFRIDHAG